MAFASFGLIMFATQIQRYYTRHSSDGGHIWWGFVLACVATALLGLSATLMLMAHKLRLLADVRRDHGGQFAHRQFSNSSFHNNVRLPDYSETGHPFSDAVSREGGEGLSTHAMPPSYETVVNCGDPEAESEEPPPPPYSQVVAHQSDPFPHATPRAVPTPDSANTCAPFE